MNEESPHPGEEVYYREFPPHAALRPYIRSYFHLQTTGKRFQQPADGCPCLMISLGDPLVFGFGHEEHEVLSGCRVLGPSSQRLFTKHAGRTNLIAVKFVPGQLGRFFRVRAFELTDTSTDIESLWGKSGRPAEQRLISQGSAPGIARLLDEVFLSRLSLPPSDYDAVIPMMFRLMYLNRGQISVDDLARSIGLSRRHVERRFAESVGLTPKRMCRIARFLNTFSRLATYEGLDWATLAYKSEYSDQAHLIRECRFFTGYSPVAYLKHRSLLKPSVMCTVNTVSY